MAVAPSATQLKVAIGPDQGSGVERRLLVAPTSQSRKRRLPVMPSRRRTAATTQSVLGSPLPVARRTIVCVGGRSEPLATKGCESGLAW